MGKRKTCAETPKTGKADVILKAFWRDNDRFADLFNATVFEGNQVLRPEMLQEADTDVSGTIRTASYDEISLNRNRDVIKKTAMGVEFAILAVESQMKIHYATPLRTMLYDGLGYQKEYSEIAKRNKEKTRESRGESEQNKKDKQTENLTMEQDTILSGQSAVSKSGHTKQDTVIGKENQKQRMTSDEFLSGMRKEDRLHPIITIVVCYSEDIWDGPVCLKDMIVDMPEQIEKVFSDYKMNLVQIRDSGQYTFYNEDVKNLFEVSRLIYEENFQKLEKEYANKRLNGEMVKLIGKITGTDVLDEFEEDEEVEGNKMCRALENLKAEGLREGKIAGLREAAISFAEMGLPVKQIAQAVKMSEETVEGWLAESHCK